MSYYSETDKVIDMPSVMHYVKGRVADIACGGKKITPDALGIDGRSLPGVDEVSHGLWLTHEHHGVFDTIFSSHFLEHTSNPSDYVINWYNHLNSGGHLILYLPEKTAYNSHENPEHMFNWAYEDFLFWFQRSFCGAGKDYKGEFLPKLFEVVDSGLDVGPNRYSFYLIGQKV